MLEKSKYFLGKGNVAQYIFFGKEIMSKKRAIVPINYMVSRFQRGIASNCGRSRFCENFILSIH